MLDFFIIEEIKRRERSERPEERPVIELPLPMPPEPSHHDHDTPQPGRDRGVVIIEFA